MKKLLFSLMAVAMACNLGAQMTPGITPDGTVHFLYFLPGNYRPTGTAHPLIISLAGIGEQGNGTSEIGNLYVGGLPLVIQRGSNMVFSYTNGTTTTTDGFVVIAPQLPKGLGWTNNYVDEVLAYATTTWNIDPQRIFLTGYSLGGQGVWDYATSSPNMNRFAGIVPISTGFPGTSPYCNITNNQVAVWAYQGGADNVYGGNVANDVTNAINTCSNVVIPAYDTTYPNEVHGDDFWNNKVYSVSNNWQIPNVFQWMLRVKRNLAPGNQIPVARATMGGQTTLNLNAPVKFKDLPILDGSASTDADDIIVSYKWEQLAGPTTYFASAPNLTTRAGWPTTAISDPGFNFALLAGNYQYRLKVQDYLTSIPGHTQFATVNLNINYPDGLHSAPAVDAGGSRTTLLTADKQRGDVFYYPCANCNGKLSQWSIVSQPAGANVQLRDYNNNNANYSIGEIQASFVNMTVDGVYKFQYAVTSQNNDVGTDILTITKTSSLPVSYAYFNGQNAGSKNILTWATTTEINSARFDVLRSTDGANFSIIGSTPSKGGTVQTDYSFDDANAPAGLAYYRLSQVDKDGKSALSKTVSVNNRKTGIYVDRYPNPVHDNLTVTLQGTLNGPVKVLIADMQGKTILQQQWQKDLSQIRKVVNVASLQQGMYQMIIVIGQEKQVSSFVKY